MGQYGPAWAIMGHRVVYHVIADVELAHNHIYNTTIDTNANANANTNVTTTTTNNNNKNSNNTTNTTNTTNTS